MPHTIISPLALTTLFAGCILLVLPSELLAHNSELLLAVLALTALGLLIALGYRPGTTLMFLLLATSAVFAGLVTWYAYTSPVENTIVSACIASGVTLVGAYRTCLCVTECAGPFRVTTMAWIGASVTMLYISGVMLVHFPTLIGSSCLLFGSTGVTLSLKDRRIWPPRVC